MSKATINGKNYVVIRRKVGKKKNTAGEWVTDYRRFYGKTKKEAEQKYKEYINRPPAGSLTFGELIDQYINSVMLPGSLKDTTKALYINAFRRIFYGSPAGSATLRRQIGELTGLDLQSALVSSGASLSTQKQCFKLLRRFFSYCERQQLARDITGGLSLPAANMKRATQEIEIFTDDELKKFINDTPEDHRLRLLIILAINTGCRISELLALTYNDIKNDQLIINKSLVQIEPVNPGEKTRIEILTTKTASSVRAIPLNIETLEAIRTHRAWHTAEQIRNNYRTEYIFTTGTGSLYYKSTIRTAFRRLCLSLEIRPRGFHCFRHSFGTRLAAAGVPIQTVSKLMGHANINVTIQYYINIPDQDKIKAINAISI